MGPRIMKPVPKFVQQFRDRHGKRRYYFRRPGFRRMALPEPTSAEFWEAYQSALAGTAVIDIGANRTKPGSVNAAVVSYFNSAAFHALAPETRRTRRNVLERYRAEHGEKRIALLQTEHIKRQIDKKMSTPFMARNFLKTLRALMQHCVDQHLREDDPTAGIRYMTIPKDRRGGFETWTEEQIVKFEDKHKIGSRARLAFALLLYTGQRRSDVLHMGRQHIANGSIRVKQQKTSVELQVPIHSDLQIILDAAPKDHLTFLTTRNGEAFSPAGFSNLFRRWVEAAGLPSGISAHGLRKACCRRLAEAGCTASEIAAISGHTSLKEVQRYTVAADQVRMAKSATEKVATAFAAKKK